MTETWSIALILLGCPVILGILLVVLSGLEDSLSEWAAPEASEVQVDTSTRGHAPNSLPVEAAAVAEGAHL